MKLKRKEGEEVASVERKNNLSTTTGGREILRTNYKSNRSELTIVPAGRRRVFSKETNTSGRRKGERSPMAI